MFGSGSGGGDSLGDDDDDDDFDGGNSNDNSGSGSSGSDLGDDDDDDDNDDVDVEGKDEDEDSNSEEEAIHNLAEALDVYPTLVEAATGGTVPDCAAGMVDACTEGRSLMPLINDPATTNWRTEAFSQVQRSGRVSGLYSCLV